MSGAADRLPRLLALVPYLRTHPGALIDDVAAEFGITVRQLRDDLNLLWVCGLPGGAPGDLIDLSFEGETVTVIDPQTLDRPLRLTADEGQALVVAARTLADVPGLAERDALDRVLAKLEGALGAGEGSAGLAVTLEAEAGVLTTVRSALDQHRRLHLRYLVEARDEVTDRDVDPMRLLSRDGRWYLEAWCHRVEAMRLFRLDRIVDLQVLDTPAVPPPEAVSRDLADGLFSPSPDDELVTLQLAPAARWVADYYPVESTEETDDGGLRIALRTPEVEWVIRLVLRLGGQGRVVEPVALIDAVRLRAAEALAAVERADQPT
ncbi:MAG TPA: YafY family protein [Frankiaceae bacterium]|nr:YafY family protein [Frankiaceae bacterium]